MLFSRLNAENDTIVEMLASALRRDIAFGVLRPDEKLKIAALRQRYGGSNHSMRETLRMLTAQGMVEATNQRGFRVTSANDEDLRDILLMRLELEGLGLARSMARGDVDWEASVIAARHRTARADADVQANPDDVTALKWDEACRVFATTLPSACGSPRLIDMIGRFYDQSRRFCLARLREGAIDFKGRAERQDGLRDAIIERNESQALGLLQDEIRAEMT